MRADREYDERYLSKIAPAAIALALTPAPNLAAALFKAKLIEREDLHLYAEMPRDCMEVVHEDMARLA